MLLLSCVMLLKYNWSSVNAISGQKRKMLAPCRKCWKQSDFLVIFPDESWWTTFGCVRTLWLYEDHLKIFVFYLNWCHHICNTPSRWLYCCIQRFHAIKVSCNDLTRYICKINALTESYFWLVKLMFYMFLYCFLSLVTYETYPLLFMCLVRVVWKRHNCCYAACR